MAEPERLPQITSHEVVATEINGQLPQSSPIVERLGEAGGRAEQAELEFTECKQGVAEIATQIDDLLLPLAGLGQRLEQLQRLLIGADGLAVGRPRACQLSRAAPIVDRLARRPGLAEMVSDDRGLVLCQLREPLNQHLG